MPALSHQKSAFRALLKRSNNLTSAIDNTPKPTNTSRAYRFISMSCSAANRNCPGDYRESYQPAPITAEQLKTAQEMADKVTRSLTGCGIWGVEFFISNKNGVYFSELSPRPHDTGMVTLAQTQNLSEFELHARTILGLPITIQQFRPGASAVVLAETPNQIPEYTGVEEALSLKNTDVRIFGKPITKDHRRMAVALTYGDAEDGSDINVLRDRAKAAAAKIKVVQK